MAGEPDLAPAALGGRAGSPAGSQAGPVARRVLREAAVVGVLWLVYQLGRGLAGRHVGRAFDNAAAIWDFERWVHLPSEAGLQAWALGWDDGMRATNIYYRYVHVTDVGLLALWLVVTRPAVFRWFRRVVVGVTCLELTGLFLVPTAPPRMRPELGIVDTGQRYGFSVYGPSYDNHGLYNQYAAMPSMHVAWSFLVALVVVTVARSRWRWLAVAHPLLMTYTVVVTGNHYWLDGIVGVVLLALTLAVFRTGAPWAAAGPPTTRGVPPIPAGTASGPGRAGPGVRSRRRRR